MLEGPEEGQLQTSDRLEAQLSLELCVEYIQVDVVILQLVEDIERSVVRRVVLSWVEDTRGIRSVGIGVDVEVALDRLRRLHPDRAYQAHAGYGRKHPR